MRVDHEGISNRVYGVVPQGSWADNFHGAKNANCYVSLDRGRRKERSQI